MRHNLCSFFNEKPNLTDMRSKPHQNQPPLGAAPVPENPAHPETPMGNLRALIMTMAMNSAPNGSLSPAQRAFVQQKLLECFPDSTPTPDHPPYSWMIQNAIENLNEEGGSSEQAISEYIVKENPSLPWAHTTLLSHHLRKLCESNEIFQTVDGYYALSNPITNICPVSSPNGCISSEHSSDKKRVNPKNMRKKDSERRKGKFGECNVSGEKVQMDAEKEATEKEDVLLEVKIDVIEEQHPSHGKMYQNDQQGQEEPANLKLDIQPQVLDDNAHVEPKEQAKQDFVSQEECYEDEEQKLSSELVHESGKRGAGKALKTKRAKMVVEEEEEIDLEIDVQLQGLGGSARKEPNKQVQQMMNEECNDEQQPNSEQGQQKGGRLGILPKRRIKKVEEEENNLEIDGQPLRFEDGAPKEASKQMRQDFVSEKCRGEQLNRDQELEKGTRRSSRVAKRNRKNNGLEEQTNKENHVLTQRLEDTDPEEPNQQIQQDLASEEYNKDEEQQLNMEQALEKRKRKQGKPHKNVVEELIKSEPDFQCQELDDAQNENEQMQQGFTSKECEKAEDQQLKREHEQMILKAIEDLNEEGGSTPVAIGNYIMRENSNSPWAYTTLIPRHLRKLCQRNEIFVTVDGYYALCRPPITNIRPTSSPDDSSKRGSDKKRVNPKTIQKKDSKRRKEGKFGKCNVRGEKVQTNTDDGATEEEDFVNRECYEDEERQLNREQVHELGKRRPGKALKRKRGKMVVEEEEEIDLEVDVQGQQKGRRLPKRRIKKVVQEEENNLEMDGQLLRFEDGARKEPNKRMRQDVVSKKRRGEQLNREQEQKGKRRSSRVPKRNRKNNDLEEQTNIEIHGLKDTDPEEPNEEQRQNTEQALEKGKRKQGKPHKNVDEEPTNSESDFQPQEQDDSQNENEQMQQGFTSNECREAEEQQLKKKRKLRRRQQHLQTYRPKTKSSEGLLTKPSAHSLQSSSQNGLQLGDRKHIKHEGSAKPPQEIRRSTRISIATSKKKEYIQKCNMKLAVKYHSQ